MPALQGTVWPTQLTATTATTDINEEQFTPTCISRDLKAEFRMQWILPADPRERAV